MATYGRWIIRAGNNCEVIEYRLEGKVNGVLVRAAGSDKWVAKIGGVPVGTPASKGNAEKELRTEIRSRKARETMSNTMTKAELEQRIAFLESMVLRGHAVTPEPQAKKGKRTRRSAVSKAVEAGERKLKSPPVYAGGPTWGQVKRAKAIVAKEHGKDLRPSEYKVAVNSVLARDNTPPFYR